MAAFKIQTLDALRRGDLAGVRELRLRERLVEFPLEIFGLADTLEVLDLSGTGLTDLPDDLGRLSRLRALFCTDNPFARTPPGLGDCPALGQISLRGCGLTALPAEALPSRLRWLTLTDNQIEDLPDALGQRPALQKLMLSGNRLSRLPESLADAGKLELLRLAANRFEALPSWVTTLPNLSWLAWSGNPMDNAAPDQVIADIVWSALRPGRLLGEGASGLVYQADWTQGAQVRPIALKLFKGTMTSDGLPDREMAACLAVGEHPNLTGALGQLVDHPDAALGLLMPLLPDHWRVLAGPPSLETCSRDVYDAAQRFDLDVALRIARDIGAGAAHLHARGLSHGDLYAHNTLWDGTTGQAVLSDFGGATFLPRVGAEAFERLEVLAWGRLLGELLERCESAGAGLLDLQRQCVATDPVARPLMREALDVLNAA